MGALSNIAGFLIASALILLAWLVYLWFNNQLSKMPASLLQEVLGGVLSFALLIAIGVVLHFLALPLSMGILTISVLLMLWYAIRKSLRSSTS